MFKSGVFNVAGAVVRIFLSLLTVPVLIRLLGIDTYGLWVLASSVVAIVTVAETALSMSATLFMSREIAAADGESASQTLMILLFGTLAVSSLIACALWLGAPAMMSLFPGLSVEQRMLAGEVVQIGSLVVWSRLMQQVLVGIEQAYFRYGQMNLLNTLQGVVINVGLMFVAYRYMEDQLLAMMVWQLLMTLVFLLAHGWLVWTLIRHMRFHMRWNRSKAQEIARYSGMSWLTALGGVLFTQVDRLFVAGLLGTAAVGIYGAITSVTIHINSMSALIIQPVLPEIASLYKRGMTDFQALHKRVRLAVEMNAVVAVAATAFLVAIAPQLIGLLQIGDGIDGNSIESYVMLFQAAAVIYCLYSLNAVGYYILFGTDQVAVNLLMGVLGGALSLILISLGALRFGLLGAVLGNLGYAITLSLNSIAMRKLKLPASQWVFWLAAPMAWLLFSLVSTIYIGAAIVQPWPLFLLLGIEMLCLLGWFLLLRLPKSRS